MIRALRIALVANMAVCTAGAVIGASQGHTFLAALCIVGFWASASLIPILGDR